MGLCEASSRLYVHPRQRLLVGLVLAVPILVLSACAPEPAGPPPAASSETGASQGADDTSAGDSGANGSGAQATVAGARTAELVVEGESFSFELTTCSVSEEDVLIAGPGTNVDNGSPAYLDIDIVRGGAMTGGARVDLGTDDPFNSAEDFYVNSIDSGHSALFTSDGDTHELVAELYLRGDSYLGSGTFMVECG